MNRFEAIFGLSLNTIEQRVTSLRYCCASYPLQLQTFSDVQEKQILTKGMLMMLPNSSSDQVLKQVLLISYSDRFSIYHRLQELRIPCSRHADGSLLVQINNWVAAILLRSTLQQFTASRQELIDWLERCWHC